MDRIITLAEPQRRQISNNDVDERRVVQRIAVHFYIAVKHDNEHLGHIINLSSSGMAMVGRVSVVPGQVLTLHVEADLEDGNRQLAEFDAKCIFSVKHVRPGLFISGFAFQTLTPKARIRVKNILRALNESSRVATG